MHTHLNFAFKRALYFSTLAIKLFNSGTKLFLAIIVNEPFFFKMLHHPYNTPTFKTILLALKGG